MRPFFRIPFVRTPKHKLIREVSDELQFRVETRTEPRGRGMEARRGTRTRHRSKFRGIHRGQRRAAPATSFRRLGTIGASLVRPAATSIPQVFDVRLALPRVSKSESMVEGVATFNYGVVDLIRAGDAVRVGRMSVTP